MASAELPLNGIRVLDLTTTIFGPLTGQILGDFGADVIKVEPPGGDTTRNVGPKRSEGMGSLFLGTNRNKRSVILDLKTNSGKDALWALVATADVFIHNMRAQKMADLGFSPKSVLKKFPELIYGQLQGYLMEGPYGGRPAYDDVIQGEAGIAGSFQARDGKPALVPSIMIDKNSALMATNGILAAIIKRERGGKGGLVEMGMFEALTAYNMVEHQYGGTFVPKMGERGYPRMLAPDRRPFETKDGHICVLPYTDAQWERFWDLAGREDLRDNESFKTMNERAKRFPELYALLAEVLLTRTSAEWLTALAEAEIPAGPVNSFDDLREDEHLNAIGFFQEVEHPTEGTIEVTDTPYRINNKKLPLTRHAPKLGADTETLLRDAGLDEQTLQKVLK